MGCKYRSKSKISKTTNIAKLDTSTNQVTSIKSRSVRSLSDSRNILGSVASTICSNRSGCLEGLVGDLIENGFSSNDVDSISGSLSSLTACPFNLDILTDFLNSIMDFIRNLIESILSAIRSFLKALLDLLKFDAFNIFNAKKTIKLTEPILTESVGTETTPNKDSNYTINESYPDSYGSIDETKNWSRIDKKEGSAELIHASTSRLIIDKDGNVTIFTKGSVKQIISKDYALQVDGNMGIMVKGNLTSHIVGNNTSNIDGNETITIKGDKTTNIDGNNSSTIKGSETKDISGEHSIKVGSSQNIKASGNITVKGSTINLN